MYRVARSASTLLPLVGLALLFSACQPQAPGRVNTSVSADQVSYYPSQSGLAWAYLKPEESLATVPYTVKIEGPASVQSRILTAVHFEGRGTERLYYREFDASGVKLWVEGAPEFYQFIYDTPVQEYPPENTLAVGKTWSGETTAKLVTREGERRIKYTYIFRVASKDKFKVGTVEYDTFLILRDNRLEYLDLSPADAAKPQFRPVVENQRIRFVPYVGEVQTREGLVLVDYNFKRKPQ